MKISIKGFTLIEILVTISILVMAIIAILQMFPLGIRVGRSAQMATIASELSQEKIEEVISSSYDDLESTIQSKHHLDPPFERYSRQTTVTYFDPNDPQATPSEDTGIKKIEVTVFWSPPFFVPEKSINIISLIAKK